MALERVNTETFNTEVLQSDKPVLVDFFATWCGPCKMLAPVMEELAAEISDTKIVKLDIDQSPEIAAEYGVMSIPTLILFRDGKPVKQTLGFLPKESLISEFSL